MLSRRGRELAHSKSSFDFVAAHFECERHRYSNNDPDGFVNFGSAQNFLNVEDIAALLSSIEVTDDEQRYQPFSGTDTCKESIANYLSSIVNNQVDANEIVVGNGIIHLLEALSISILDSDDSVLIPTPVFPGLVAALRLRHDLDVKFLHTDSSNGFRVSPEDIEDQIVIETSSDSPIKAVLLCSPGNPVGQVFTDDELRELVEIAERHDVVMIVDEVYASSCWGEAEFSSAVAERSEHVVVLGGLSKDFGLAGFATGWLQSTNEDIVAAVARQSHFLRLPTLTQRVTTRVLDPAWRRYYLAENSRRLTCAVEIAKEALSSAGIHVAPSDGGLCLWLDLGTYLSSHDAVGELKLYKQLLMEHRVHVSPGGGLFCNEPGFYRICFSHDEATLREGLRRLIHGLTGVDFGRDRNLLSNIHTVDGAALSTTGV